MTETINQETGEVTEEVGADGRRRYPAVSTLTDLIHMLNDGQFNYDCADALGECAEKMECLGCDTGKKQKAKIVLTVEVEREADGIYFFTPSLAVKLPQEKAARTIGWVTKDNKFTPNRPGQGNLFGTIRDVMPARRVIDQ